MFPFISSKTHQRIVNLLAGEMSELKGRVDRAVHEETVRLLKERIVELEQSLGAARADLRAITDTQTAYIFGQVLRDGKRTMFDPRQTREQAENEIPIAKTPEQERVSEVTEARRATGSNDVRVLTRYIENRNRKRYEAKLRNQSVPPDFEEAIAQGKQAANSPGKVEAIA